MRRVLSWRRSVGTIVALAGMTPGLLVLSTYPSTATSAAEAVNDAAASPVIPQQMRGSAQSLPSLLPTTELEQVPEPRAGWKAEVQPPEGAVPAEDRMQDSGGSQPDEDLPAGDRKSVV